MSPLEMANLILPLPSALMEKNIVKGLREGTALVVAQNMEVQGFSP
jgi:hypothetical protein